MSALPVAFRPGLDWARAAELEAKIARLIAQQRYEDAQELLPAYAGEVVACSNTDEAAQRFQKAKAFLRTAMEAIKAQRAHDAEQFAALTAQRAYLGDNDTPAQLDVTG